MKRRRCSAPHFISSRIIWVSSEIEFPVPIQAAAAPRADKSVIPGQRVAQNTWQFNPWGPTRMVLPTAACLPALGPAALHARHQPGSSAQAGWGLSLPLAQATEQGVQPREER